MTLTEARERLADVEREIAAAITKPESFTVGGVAGGSRQTVNRPIADLIKLRDFYRAEVTKLERGGIRIRRGVPIS